MSRGERGEFQPDFTCLFLYMGSKSLPQCFVTPSRKGYQVIVTISDHGDEKIVLFWEVTPSNPVVGYWRIRGKSCLRHWGRRMNSVTCRTTLRILLNWNVDTVWHISQVFKELSCLSCTYFYKHKIPIWSVLMFFIFYWLLFQFFLIFFFLIWIVTVQTPRSLILFTKNAGAGSIERVQMEKTKRMKRINEQMERIGKVGTSLTAYMMKGEEQKNIIELSCLLLPKKAITVHLTFLPC